MRREFAAVKDECRLLTSIIIIIAHSGPATSSKAKPSLTGNQARALIRLVRLSACLGNFCPLLRSVGQLLPGSVSFEPGTFVGQAEHVFFCELGCALRRPLELVSLASLEGSQQNMEGWRDRMHQSWHVHDLQVHPRHAQHRLMLWLSGTMHTAFEQQAHYGQVHSIGTQKCRARSGMSLSGAIPTDIQGKPLAKRSQRPRSTDFGRIVGSPKVRAAAVCTTSVIMCGRML